LEHRPDATPPRVTSELRKQDSSSFRSSTTPMGTDSEDKRVRNLLRIVRDVSNVFSTGPRSNAWDAVDVNSPSRSDRSRRKRMRYIYVSLDSAASFAMVEHIGRLWSLSVDAFLFTKYFG
jgi:hypothetical protein